MFLLAYQFENKKSVLVFGMIMVDERSPMQGLEPETPSPLERLLTTEPQPHAWFDRVFYYAYR